MKMMKYLIKHLQFLLLIEFYWNVYDFFDTVLIEKFLNIDFEDYLQVHYNLKYYSMRQRILDERMPMVFETKMKIEINNLTLLN